MLHWFMLISGGIFFGVMILTGARLRRAGRDVAGRTPIARPLFLTGKLSMGVLWAMALVAAAGNVGACGPATWMQTTGAVLFMAGCGLSLAAFAAMGDENRFGLPDGKCRLKTGGLYAWARHPMYTGFYLMSAGAFFYALSVFAGVILLLSVGIHHRIALAEERFMAGQFGSEWKAYAGAVPRYGGFRLKEFQGGEASEIEARGRLNRTWRTKMSSTHVPGRRHADADILHRFLTGAGVP